MSNGSESRRASVNAAYGFGKSKLVAIPFGENLRWLEPHVTRNRPTPVDRAGLSLSNFAETDVWSKKWVRYAMEEMTERKILVI